jgi:GGDEF domain-containing protein
LRGSDSFAELHPDDRERVKQVFRDTVRTGIGRQIHYRMLLADGTVREMESAGNVIRDSQGQITQVVVVAHDVTERHQMEEKMRQLAFHDALTQLPNRRLLNDRLNQVMAASARSGCYAALMFLDLDNFKLLNDTHGHQHGDLLLIEAADRLKRCVRETDTVARIGGDEYVVVVSELATAYAGSGEDPHALSARAERLPALRPRQVDLPQLRPGARLRRPLPPALRRHQPGEGRAGIRRFDHRRGEAGWASTGRADGPNNLLFRFRLFRLRCTPAPNT